jgi:[ribosomal protein S5]-alanine N-acetyltransferase
MSDELPELDANLDLDGNLDGVRLQRLQADHSPALRVFETANRDYFSRSVPDRGDQYFAEFDDRHRALLEEQASGSCYFHVLVDAGGQIIGRVNLVDVADGTAELGYRIAERAAGRGLATAAVRRMCEVARISYGLTVLRAATTLDNPASQRVLTRAGFDVVGETVFDGRPGLLFSRALA